MPVDGTADGRATEGIDYAGVGDEAAPGLADQIAAHARLGWSSFELRTVDGVAAADLDDAAFATVEETLGAAGLRVVCVDSRIGNWGRPITADLDDDLRELAVLGRRCAALGTPYLRIMSYPNDGLTEPQWAAEAIRRIRELTRRAADLGLTLLHENCAGWAGTRADRMLRLLDEVDHPSLRLLFDIGNGPAYGYAAHELLPEVVDRVAHVHVKDAIGGGERTFYVRPGDGDCRVADCLRTLLSSGYRGTWSIEPHLAVRPHEGRLDAGADGVEGFVAYGRALRRLVREEVLPAVPGTGPAGNPGPPAPAPASASTGGLA